MKYPSEIKNFTKNTLILTLLFTLVLHLSWTYVRPYMGGDSFADNAAKFEIANTSFLGTPATAISLSVGLKEKAKDNTPVALSISTMSVAEALANTKEWQKTLITDNMIAITAYVSLLQTDIGSMLDQSVDRTRALDDEISILKTYYVRTGERLKVLNGQIGELNNILNDTSAAINAYKGNIQIAYKGLDYDTLESSISVYMKAKQDEVKSHTFLVFLSKFVGSYTALQEENARILDALINNREAIIKRATFVIPNTGTDVMKRLNLIQSEADYKASQNQ